MTRDWSSDVCSSDLQNSPYAYVSVIRSSDKDKIRVRVYSNKDKVNFDEDDGRLSVERSYRDRKSVV